MGRRLTTEQREAILRTGIRAFARQGYDRANINSIAAEAGISVGVLYKYYGSKEQFFLACVRQSLAVLHDLLDPAKLQNLAPAEIAEKFVRAAVEFSRENQDVILLYHQITNGGPGENTRALAREIESATSETYVRIMTDLQDRGVLRPDADPAYLAMAFDDLLMMLQFTGSCPYYEERWKIYCGERDEEKLIRQMTRILTGFMA